METKEMTMEELVTFINSTSSYSEVIVHVGFGEKGDSDEERKQFI